FCKVYAKCSHTADFTRFKQEKDGVKASCGNRLIPYTQIKEVNDFINKSCECIHIDGEEPYNEQRTKELEKIWHKAAMIFLECV
ncbi:hypothetical protein, partial [Helicobacter bilis]|uniref:hypothetical protein n=1 Tax=Helicobacter bilis TaxID=37372 RepID=UPI002A83B2CB